MVGHTGDTKTPADEEDPDPLPQRAGYPEQLILCLLCNISSYQMYSIAALLLTCYMLLLDCFCFLILVISTLQTFYPQVCQSNVTCVSALCNKLCSDVKKTPPVHVQNCRSPISEKMHIWPRSCRSNRDIPNINTFLLNSNNLAKSRVWICKLAALPCSDECKTFEY